MCLDVFPLNISGGSQQNYVAEFFLTTENKQKKGSKKLDLINPG